MLDQGKVPLINRQMAQTLVKMLKLMNKRGLTLT